MHPDEPQTPEQAFNASELEASEQTDTVTESTSPESGEEAVNREPVTANADTEGERSEMASDSLEEEVPEPEVQKQPLAPEPVADSETTEEISETEGKEQPAVLDIISESVEEVVAVRVAEFEQRIEQLQVQVSQLEQKKQALEQEVNTLQEQKGQVLAQQAAETQATLGEMVKRGLQELEQRQQAIQLSIEQLERRRERIREEMRTTFAGVSQELAVRVQGFKDYLVGSLQDLAIAAEQLDLPTYEQEPEYTREEVVSAPQMREPAAPTPQFADQKFQDQRQRIRQLLDQYRTFPDYYGPPWQLRRTFEPIHAERVQQWFFQQGGRGAIRELGSRLQNILIASAVISVLRAMYGDRVRTLVLASTPERLGEWRRGLQDCLGISRSDFGPERGVVLFEDSEPLAIKAERLVEDQQLPLIIIDEARNQISLSLLEFPLWLAFAPDPKQASSYLY